ncbi:MAG: TolC family protein [Bdellovibrionales bacterium]|jgi:outer membrane protein TolC|nr:TolC family protein [Bdellovibrionales bacterium]
MRTHAILSLLLLASPSPLFAQEASNTPSKGATTAKSITVQFDDIPKLIESKNGRIVASRLEIEASRKQEGHLARSFLPAVEISGAIETFKLGDRPSATQPTYGAELSVPLFNAFQDSLEEQRRKATTLEKEASSKVLYSTEIATARASYWNLLHARKLSDLLRGALRINENNMRAAERRIKSGVATETDRLEFEMRSVNLERDLASTLIEITRHQRTLAIALGLDIDSNISTNSTLDHQHDWKKELAHNEAEHEFQVQELIARKNETEAIAKQEARKPLPRVEAFAGFNHFNERGSDHANSDGYNESVVGLRVKMNIGDFWESNAKRQAANIQTSALQSRIHYERQEIESHIISEMNELSFLHSQVHAAEENIKRANRYYTLTQAEYARGVKNSPDVVGASDRLLDTQIKGLTILRDFQIARSHVLSKTGR